MTDAQWQILLDVIGGAAIDPLPVGFIIDSPWLPGWAGVSLMDYYTSESCWLSANMRAVERFPEILFLPGFWSEWGMCTEPSAFGAKCVWQEDEFPFAAKLRGSLADLAALETPNPQTDGLTPFVLKRLAHTRQQIEAAGYKIRFAVARGPLNIAGFLAGNTELLMGMKLEPDAVHALVEKITDFLVRWVQLQAATFPTIDGVFLLDDVVGFCGEDDFVEFAKPCLKRVFDAVDVRVKFFHNDAAGLVSAPHLAAIGINLFNFAFEHTLPEMQALVGDQVTLLGNIPPRDVMARGGPDDVRQAVREILDSVADTRRVILSCGGGMPPAVPTENIEAFLEAARGA
jgi:uroporphyrinogen-III decarboxylase